MTWAYVPPSMFSDFALESEAWSSESELQNPALAESLTWRGKPLPSALWSRRWKRGGFIRLLSGLMLEPSMAARGVELFIASLRATPASPTPSPESAREAATTDGSSTSFSGSWRRAGLIVSSAKTSRGTSTDSSTPSSRLWKGWAIALRLESSQRGESEPPIDASDSSSWQTARTVTGAYTRDGGEKGKERPSLHGQAEEWPTARAISGGANSKRAERGAGGPDLQEAVSAWPTPSAEAPNDREEPESWRTRQAMLAGKGYNGNGAGVPLSIAAKEMARDWQTPGTDSFRGRGGDRKAEAGLDRQAREWGSPRASDGEKGSPNQSFGGGGEPLAAQAANWPTPDTQNHRDGRQRRKMDVEAEKRGSRKGRSLHHEVEAWPTPTACSPNSLRGSGQDPEERKADGRTINLQGAACHWPTPAARDWRGANSEESQDRRNEDSKRGQQLPNFIAHAYSPPDLPTRAGRESLRPLPFSPLPSDPSMSGTLLESASAFRRWSIRSGGAGGWSGTWIRRPRRSLNPLFVELMMGWPFGLSGFARVGTGLSPWLEAMRGRLLELHSPPTGPQGELF